MLCLYLLIVEMFHTYCCSDDYIISYIPVVTLCVMMNLRLLAASISPK